MRETSQAVAAGEPGIWGSIKPYLEKESLAAFFVGVSSGFPYAMIGATLTTRLAQDGIDKKTVTVTFDADKATTAVLVKATTDAGFPSTPRK